ncbi:MAG TPA: acyltransferase [Planctomycetota bacterium]|jgi:peptidoglycan/LPS O-acetylase OafA/YrhL
MQAAERPVLQTNAAQITASLPRRMPELDGIRGIAILLVLYWHYCVGQLTPEFGTWTYYLCLAGGSAWSGVDLFFVLSGFLLGGILIDNRRAPNLLRVFYVRRFCRIFPVYYVSIAVFSLAVISVKNLPQWMFGPSLPLWTYWLYVQNFWMWFQFSPGPGCMGMTWSLAIEEHFYLVLPWVLIYVRPKMLPWVLSLLILVAPVLRLIMVQSPQWMIASIMILPCRWDSLFLGVLGAWLVRREEFMRWAREHMGVLYGAFLAFLSGVVLLSALHTLPGALGWRAFASLTCFALFYLSLILVAVVPEKSLLKRLLSARWLRGTGTIAYGLYLFHQAVAGLCYFFLLGKDQPQISNWKDALTTLLALCLTFLLAIVSFRYFELPITRLGHQVAYSSPPPDRVECVQSEVLRSE